MPIASIDADMKPASKVAVSELLERKLLSGIEHARMNHRDVVTVFAGFRLFFGPHSNAPYPGNKLLKGIW
jgi:hypothetical protein